MLFVLLFIVVLIVMGTIAYFFPWMLGLKDKPVKKKNKKSTRSMSTKDIIRQGYREARQKGVEVEFLVLLRRDQYRWYRTGQLSKEQYRENMDIIDRVQKEDR